ncbi:MAG TPA: hypothetical protein DCQ06_05080 [Myxococcales bacterium]|nr:hypothetical protein [Myxococcales bacterium]HAN30950.1 hypothetical protein [Myxococcales bacterium]
MRNLVLVAIWSLFAHTGCEGDSVVVPLAGVVEQALNDPSLLPHPVTTTVAEPAQPATQATETVADEDGIDASAAVEHADSESQADAGLPGAAGEPSEQDSAVGSDGPKPTVAKVEEPTIPAPNPRALKAVVAKPKARVSPRAKRSKRSVAPRRPMPKPPKVTRPKVVKAPKPAPEPEQFEDGDSDEELDPTELLYQGKRACRMGRYKEAIRLLRISQRLRPSAQTLTLLGRAYFDAGQLKMAQKTLVKAGRGPEPLLLLATLYQQMGQAAKARKMYKAFLTYHPEHPKADRVRQRLRLL